MVEVWLLQKKGEKGRWEDEPAALPSGSLSQDDGEPQSKGCPLKEPVLGRSVAVLGTRAQ